MNDDTEDTTDDRLLECLRRGDGSAFENLFLRYYGQVYRVLYNLVSCHEEAEDLAQETFLALYHHPPTLQSGDGLAAWISRVALNRGYNALRSEKRSQQRIDRIGRLDMSISADDPYTEAARSEDRAYVRAILSHLPERQGQLLILRYAGLSYAEIAAVLKVAPGSVGTLLARAERAFVKAHQQLTATHQEEKVSA